MKLESVTCNTPLTTFTDTVVAAMAGAALTASPANTTAEPKNPASTRETADDFMSFLPIALVESVNVRSRPVDRMTGMPDFGEAAFSGVERRRAAGVGTRRRAPWPTSRRRRRGCRSGRGRGFDVDVAF